MRLRAKWVAEGKIRLMSLLAVIEAANALGATRNEIIDSVADGGYDATTSNGTPPPLAS